MEEMILISRVALEAVVEQAVTRALSKQEKRMEKVLTVKEACAILNISSRTLNRMTKEGEIRATVLRSRPGYEESEVQRVILNKRR
jgi:excisionase family DNA binding protein